jgi:hypothetical protein
MSECWKLNAKEIRKLVKQNIITSKQATDIIEASLKRAPHTFDDNVLKICVDKKREIYINSIHFYGGENFNKPYYFLAEMTCLTTYRRFVNFCRKHNIPMRHFNY